MADGLQDASRHAGQVVRRVLLRRNIAIDAETAQLHGRRAGGQGAGVAAGLPAGRAAGPAAAGGADGAGCAPPPGRQSPHSTVLVLPEVIVHYL